MKNEFEVAFNEISELRALPTDVVLEALRTALISAYRRDSNASAAQNVDATIDPETGRARIFVEKEVVDGVESPNTEVDLEKARYYHPEAQLGDTVMVQVEGTTKKFGRIAAQTAKQVILQKIREAERDALYEEYIEKEGDIINGQVQSINPAMVTLSLGRAEAILPRAQQIPNERYKQHDKVRCYVLEVKKTNRGPQIVVSRSHRNMLRRLLEFEVPEIYNGQIEIKNIAREAGYRSKVAVAALQEGIDPVGACVGMRGIRIQNIVKELHDEKIDVIQWSSDQDEFIRKSLSPARVTGVYLDDDPDSGRTAVVIVPDDQLSLAIGREGQNARLAAKLTGWRIDIKSVTEAVMYAFDHLGEPPLSDLLSTHTDMLEEISIIVDKKESGRAIMPEEFRVLSDFADIAEKKLQSVREEARKARVEEINAVKMTLPQFVFAIPATKLDLPDKMLEVLQPFENVGEIWLRFLIDENRLRRILGGNSDEALMQLQEALDKLIMSGDELVTDVEEVISESPEVVEAVETATPEIAVEEAPEPELIEAPVEPVEAPVESVAELEETIEDAVEETEVQLDAFPDLPAPAPEPVKPEPAVVMTAKPAEPIMDEADEYNEADDAIAGALDDAEDDGYDDDDDDLDSGKGKKKRRKERQKRRQLVFDEATGQTFSKRRRKGGRKRQSWDDAEY